MQRLKDRDELVLLPYLVWDHLASHDLYGPHHGRRPSNPILDEGETKAFVEVLSRGWQSAMHAGLLLAQLCSPAPLILLQNAGQWDQGCRDALSLRLKEDAAFDHFVLLFFSGGTAQQVPSKGSWIARSSRAV